MPTLKDTKGTLIVPPVCLPQIKAQRTSTKKATDPAAKWSDSIRADWAETVKYHPGEVRSVLDLGCGLGGYDVFLHRTYSPNLYMLDRNEWSDVVGYGYSKTPSAYCHFVDVQTFMAANDVSPSAYTLTVDLFDAMAPLDMVVSFVSWGFHYPIAAYLDRVAPLMRPGARLIIDLRTSHASEAFDQIRAAIGRSVAVMAGVKHVRCVFEKG